MVESLLQRDTNLITGALSVAIDHLAQQQCIGQLDFERGPGIDGIAGLQAYPLRRHVDHFRRDDFLPVAEQGHGDFLVDFETRFLARFHRRISAVREIPLGTVYTTCMLAAVTPMHDAPFAGRAVWQDADFGSSKSWDYRLPAAVLSELDAAIRRIRDAGREISTLSKADFPAPSFAADAEAIRHGLESGRGFVVVTGLPIDSYTDAEATWLYWGIATHLGQPIPQNAKDEYLFAVRDEGYNFHRDYGAAGVRISRTSSAIDFHTDSSANYAGYTPDIVSLLALQTAKTGGMTALVSAQTVHNILRRERPDCLRRLYQPFYFDRRAEMRPGDSPTLEAPVFSCDDALAIRFFRFNLLKGHETAGVPLTPADMEAVEALEEVCRRPGLAVSFEMRRGEMQFVNNRTVLHSRTAFEDHEEPDRRRHLVRLWLKYRGQN